MIIKLPKAKVPNWYGMEFNLSRFEKVCFVDDDQSIHQVWNSKTAKIEGEISISHEYIPSKVRPDKETLYFIDFQYSGTDMTGLDLIESLGIEERSVLVTSHYQDVDILKALEKKKIKMIPKPLLEFARLVLEDSIQCKYDLVYIEDESVFRDQWEMFAKKKGLKLLTIANLKELGEKIPEIDLETPIFIDDKLEGEKISGREVARRLGIMGFRKIYLSTGMSSSVFDYCFWLSGVFNKKFPPISMI